jgi:hypothetical protein
MFPDNDEEQALISTGLIITRRTVIDINRPPHMHNYQWSRFRKGQKTGGGRMYGSGEFDK